VTHSHRLSLFIRKVKRDEDKIIIERLAESLLNNGARDLLSEIKHIRSSKTGISCYVDGHTEATIYRRPIDKLFADKYRDLYTSVQYPYDAIDMQHIQDEVNCLLTNEPSLADCIFNFHDVQNAVSRLKAHN